MTDSEFDIDQDEPEYVSKTQLKSESKALQKLGESLVNLGAAALEKIPMDDELEDAVNIARRINKKERRLSPSTPVYWQTHTFAGCLKPIEQALFEIQNSHQRATQQFHQMENTRDNLLNEGDDAINELLNEHDHLDRQKLRQLVRAAAKQKEQNKPPKAARELFQYLKENLDN